MTLFPYNNPVLTAADRRRLSPFLGNQKAAIHCIREHRPQAADLKRMVMLEMERPTGYRKDVVTSLLVALQKKEREGIWEKIRSKKPKA